MAEKFESGDKKGEWMRDEVNKGKMGVNEEEYDDVDEEMSRILEAQLEQMKQEREWNDDGIAALRTEMEGDNDPLKWQPPMTDYQWAKFLHEWRSKLGEWGKRVLEVNQCDADDRAKAAHLLVEIHRRRLALASCKVHILKLLDAAGQGNQPSTSNNADQK